MYKKWKAEYTYIVHDYSLLEHSIIKMCDISVQMQCLWYNRYNRM